MQHVAVRDPAVQADLLEVRRSPHLSVCLDYAGPEPQLLAPKAKCSRFPTSAPAAGVRLTARLDRAS